LLHKGCKVKELKLNKTKVSDEGAILIFKALEINTSLNVLNLGSNNLTDNLYSSILNCINSNKNLRSINLINNKFGASFKENIKLKIRKELKIIL